MIDNKAEADDLIFLFSLSPFLFKKIKNQFAFVHRLFCIVVVIFNENLLLSRKYNLVSLVLAVYYSLNY